MDNKIRICIEDVEKFNSVLSRELNGMSLEQVLWSAGMSTCARDTLGNQSGGADWADVVAAILLAAVAVGGVAGAALAFMWLFPVCKDIPREYMRWWHFVLTPHYDFRGAIRGASNLMKTYYHNQPLEQVCKVGEVPWKAAAAGSAGIMGLLALAKKYTHTPLAALLRRKFGSRENLDREVLEMGLEDDTEEYDSDEGDDEEEREYDDDNEEGREYDEEEREYDEGKYDEGKYDDGEYSSDYDDSEEEREYDDSSENEDYYGEEREFTLSEKQRDIAFEVQKRELAQYEYTVNKIRDVLKAPKETLAYEIGIEELKKMKIDVDHLEDELQKYEKLLKINQEILMSYSPLKKQQEGFGRNLFFKPKRKRNLFFN